MTTGRKTFCSCLLVLLFCSGLPGDDKPADANAKSVAKVLDSLAAAYNARDSKALGDLFTPQGEFIDGDGNVFQGRQAIAGEFSALFEVNPKNSVVITAEDIREISAGVLSVDGVVSFPTENESDQDDVDLSALLIRQPDGNWLLGSLRGEGENGARSPHAFLKRLAWLIGDWVDESAESTMHTSSRWSEDGNFIVSTFTINVAGRKVKTGTQRIGWDGSLEKFRSWVFDSEGGHAEGIWTEIDERWIVKATGVTADGDVSSATQTYEQHGPDGFEFASTARIVGNESQPDFTARVVRKPPEPKPAAGAPAAPRGK